MRKLIGLTIVFGLALALLSSPMVTASTEAEEEIISLLLKYEQGFETGDLEVLGELFWQDERLTVFWPEPESAFRIDGWTQLRGFTDSLSQMADILPPGGVNLEIRQPSINVMGDVAIMTGYFVQTMFTPEGSQVIQGRITTVWKKMEGKWVIVHEHSSLFPTP